MARYIDADELAIKIGALDLYGTDDRNRLITWHPEQNSIPYVLITDVLNAVNNQPVADVVERKKGEWTPANNVGDCCYKCSICGYVYDAYSLRADNFCQSCGADMRGEKDG